MLYLKKTELYYLGLGRLSFSYFVLTEPYSLTLSFRCSSFVNLDDYAYTVSLMVHNFPAYFNSAVSAQSVSTVVQCPILVQHTLGINI